MAAGEILDNTKYTDGISLSLAASHVYRNRSPIVQ